MRFLSARNFTSCPPLPQTLFAACQHLLAMFVAVITPAILICQALKLPAHDTQRIMDGLTLKNSRADNQLNNHAHKIKVVRDYGLA